MYIQQADFFCGTSMVFANAAMKIAVQNHYLPGEFIFKEGDPAHSLYVLLKGRVRICIGEPGEVVYSVSRGGEAFGWSSLVGRPSYSAAAVCLEPTQLIAFDRDRFQRVLEMYPEDAITLYRGLALTLASRLLQAYKMVTAGSAAGRTPCLGSGQFSESDLQELPETIDD
jgi:CRP-like cAMP-binding protein